VAASYRWDDYVDLVTIRRFDRIITAPVPAPQHAHINVFDPKAVVWAYEEPPQPTLQALLNLVPPHHLDAPASVYLARVCCIGGGKARQAEVMRRRGVRVSAPRLSFAGFRSPRDVIMVAVRWYLRYGLSYRDVEELLVERGIVVDHVTVYRWVQRFTPLLVDAARPCRHTPRGSMVRG
jgi:hypothetical protein